MFTNTRDMKDLVICGTDGELGCVKEVYFDDETWAIRYLTVETGKWLAGRQVLISPISVAGADWKSYRLDVALTMNQVEQSPDIDAHKPVSCQQEAGYLSYYGYPYYWDHPYARDPAYYPAGLTSPTYASLEARGERIRRAPMDVHLRSSETLTGYHLHALDGEVGHVDRFIVDDEAWTIRYLEVSTQNWWPGKKVLLSPAWVERVSWEQSKVFVGLKREAIQTCEEYLDGTPITGEYENRLYFHYGRPPYWLNQAGRETARASVAAASAPH